MPLPGYILAAIGMAWFALDVRDGKHHDTPNTYEAPVSQQAQQGTTGKE